LLLAGQLSAVGPSETLTYRNCREPISLSRQALHKGHADAATTPAVVQQTGRRKRLTGVAPRAIWAALWIQSSWGGKPHRSQRSQSPQVKLDLRGRDRRAIPLGEYPSNDVECSHHCPPWIRLPNIRRLSSATLIKIKSNDAAVKSRCKQRELLGHPQEAGLL
jgi:hypothetical protein